MARDDVQVSFNIELETRKLQQKMALFDRSIKKSSMSIDKMAKREKILFGGSGEFQKHLKKAQQAQEKYARVLIQSSKQIYDARAGLAAATTDAERAEIQKRISLYEKEKVAAIKSAKKTAHETQSVLSKAVHIDTGELARQLGSIKMPKMSDFAKEIGAEAKESITEAISSIKGKDLVGIFKGGSGLAAALLKGGGGYAGAGLKKAGAAVSDKGHEMAGKAGAGGMDKAFGGLLKVIGPILGKMGSMFGIVAKMGPLLSTLSSAIVGIVKLMIDVESQAKEINKDILESAGTAELFAKQGYNVGVSMASLDDTLTNIKDQTHDIAMNFAMGTNAKQHMAVIGVLNREGVTLGNLQERLDANRDSANELRKSMSKFTDVTRMAIGFSRLFGVSIEEIAGFQSEMMTDLGVNLEDTKREWSRMTNAAVESGIAANKFFAIIRGVSSDLSLYGVRIGDVTKALKGLGKVMSPRTAQKFLTSFAQGMKGFSSDDALKMTLLGGPGAVQNIAKDLADQKKDIIAQVAAQAQVSPEEAEALLKGGKDKQGRTLTKLAKDKIVTDIGTKREAFQGAERGERQMKEGGTYGAAMAAKGLSGYGAYALKKQAALGLSGKKTLEGSIGLRGEKSAEAAGLGGEKFDELLGVERAIEQQQKDLVAGVDEGDPKVLDQLTKLGIINAGMDAQAKKDAVAKMSESQVFDSLQSDTETEKDIEKKMLSAAEEQGTKTQSMLDKLDIVVDALFNWLYKIMVSIWDALVGLWASLPSSLGGGAAKTYQEKNKMARIVLDSKDPALMKALQEGGEDVGKVKGSLITGEIGSNISNTLDAYNKTFGDIDKQIAAGGEAGDAAKLKKQEMIKSDPALRALSEAQGKIQTGVGSNMKPEQIMAAAKMAGLSGDKYDKLFESVNTLVGSGTGEENVDLTKAMTQAGLSTEDTNKILQKGLWAMDPTQAATVGSKVNKDIKATGGVPAVAPGSPTATGQTASTGKSAAPGTAGAAAPVAGGGAAVPPPSTAAGAGAAIPITGTGTTLPISKGDEQVMEVLGDGTTDVVNNLHDLWVALRSKGIKLDKTHALDVIEKGTLDSIRKGLFEYAVYTSSDPAKLLESIDKSAFGDVDKLAEQFKGGEQKLVGHATGGVVTGISGGLAQISAAPGEGLASIGPGERILPAGGGGGGKVGDINLYVNGIGGADLANYLKDKIAQGIYEYKKREKLT